MTVEEILKDYDDLEEEDIQAVLLFAIAITQKLPYLFHSGDHPINKKANI